MQSKQTPQSMADLFIGAPGYPNGRCTARSKKRMRENPEASYDEIRCPNPVVLGMRVCRFHGGVVGRMQKAKTEASKKPHEQYVVPLKSREMFERFLSDSAWADLAKEVALTRTMVQSYLDGHEADTEQEQKHIAFLLEKVGLLVEKKHKIEFGEKYTLNISTLYGYAARIAEIINRNVSDESARAIIRDQIKHLFGEVDVTQLDMLTLPEHSGYTGADVTFVEGEFSELE